MAVEQNQLTNWFSEWYLPLQRFLLRRSVGTKCDVEDIAQEVFLRVLNYDRAEFIEHPQAYLYKIAANVAAEWSTRLSRNRPHSAEWLGELVDTAQPDTTLEQQQAEAELSRAIAELPARFREILRLRFAEGLTNEVIADRLGLTRRTIKRDLAHAYVQLRYSLGDEGESTDRPRQRDGSS